MKFLITAGPTREPLDAVRYLSNRSSGKMGYAIAAAALEEKHQVTLISGPVALADPLGAKVIRVTTGNEMFEAASAQIGACDVFVMCAAVCDYKPAHYSAGKMKKHDEPFALALEPTRDILASLTSVKHDCFVVGFAAETQDLAVNATRKLREKNCDLLVANDVSHADLGMESDENELMIFLPNDEPRKVARGKKTELARTLLKIILNARENCLTKKT
ncbi:MAG: phosphopantothenoylcysteine decarboxylase [Chthoniobacterales bacterium]|nr:phosphopantothenoylcysteine decarboxylase [Chthoniobacterales bacterium]